MSALPTREEIAEIVESYEPTSMPSRRLAIADALLARLRPTWQSLHDNALRRLREEEQHRERVTADLSLRLGIANEERDALRADLARLERQVNASVTTENYKALVLKLGDVNADLQRAQEQVHTYHEQLKRYVSALEAKDADLRACTEALKKYGTHLEGCGRLAYDTWTPRKPEELNCTCGLFDAALARPGVQAERKK